MKRLHFDYYMELEYSQPVCKSSFTLKCIPTECETQMIEEMFLEVEPYDSICLSYDSFGNRMLFGNKQDCHSRFAYHMEGVARTGLAPCNPVTNPSQVGKYRYFHGLVKDGEEVRAYWQHLSKEMPRATDYDKALYYMHALHQDFSYQTSVTGMYTDSEQAWRLGMGVCQDYTHILIALCRMEGIPARYVTGMLIAEGSSHAWVEVLYEGGWYGLDPTNDLVVDDSHIRIGVGRDATDCLVNRGIFKGNGMQQQRVKVRVEEI